MVIEQYTLFNTEKDFHHTLHKDHWLKYSEIPRPPVLEHGEEDLIGIHKILKLYVVTRKSVRTFQGFLQSDPCNRAYSKYVLLNNEVKQAVLSNSVLFIVVIELSHGLCTVVRCNQRGLLMSFRVWRLAVMPMIGSLCTTLAVTLRWNAKKNGLWN